MPPTNELLDVQRKIEEWIAGLPIDQLSEFADTHGVPFADATLHACAAYVDNFLDRLVYDEHNIDRLHELYYYRSEEQDELRMRAEDVEGEPSPSSPIDLLHAREYKLVKRGAADMFTMRHDIGYFPNIDTYGTDLLEDEQLAFQLVTDVHQVADVAYDAIDQKEIELEKSFRELCFKMYEVCRTSMAALAGSESARDLGITVEPMKWFEHFLVVYRIALEHLVNEAGREPDQETGDASSEGSGPEKRRKITLH